VAGRVFTDNDERIAESVGVTMVSRQGRQDWQGRQDQEPARPRRTAPGDRPSGDDACRTCYGSGLESFTDDGGDVVNRDCTSCAGNGFR
jgi:hypothetical protein